VLRLSGVESRNRKFGCSFRTLESQAADGIVRGHDGAMIPFLLYLKKDCE
jgi:hypothetical protein